MINSLIKAALLRYDPEKAQEVVLQQLKRIIGTPAEWLVRQNLPTKSVNCMGIDFKNPVGLAAGIDKNGEYIDIFNAIGFGFIEIGTITPKNQSGNNNKPRLFRLEKVHGLINRIGFDNVGVEKVVENLQKTKFGGILGISISKNEDTKIERSKEDYLFCIDKVYEYASYISLNIAPSLTTNLSILHLDEIFDDLLSSVKNKQKELQNLHKKYVPILLKITPDMTESELTKFVDSVKRFKIDGIIATDGTIRRDLVQGIDECNQKGFLSGRPLQLKSTEIIKKLSVQTKGKIPIIGVGGIDSLISAREKILAGASLIQIYSGFIFHGPKLIKDIISYI